MPTCTGCAREDRVVVAYWSERQAYCPTCCQTVCAVFDQTGRWPVTEAILDPPGSPLRPTDVRLSDGDVEPLRALSRPSTTQRSNSGKQPSTRRPRRRDR